MSRKVTFLPLMITTIVLLAAPAARAQYGSGGTYGSDPVHRMELSPFGGYVWTMSREVYYDQGYERTKMDIKDSGFWGLALDLNVRGGNSQIELLYQRQDSEMNYGYTDEERTKISDVAVEYYQIGGLSGIRRDRFFGFGGLSLGATRLVLKDPGFDNTTRFSMIFNLGAKAYLNDRIGLRVQGSLPFTFIQGGTSLGCSGSGCYSTVGGEVIGQINLSGGLLILL